MISDPVFPDRRADDAKRTLAGEQATAPGAYMPLVRALYELSAILFHVTEGADVSVTIDCPTGRHASAVRSKLALELQGMHFRQDPAYVAEPTRIGGMRIRISEPIR